jgi:hypothetical protein
VQTPVIFGYLHGNKVGQDEGDGQDKDGGLRGGVWQMADGKISKKANEIAKIQANPT